MNSTPEYTKIFSRVGLESQDSHFSVHVVPISVNKSNCLEEDLKFISNSQSRSYVKLCSTIFNNFVISIPFLRFFFARGLMANKFTNRKFNLSFSSSGLLSYEAGLLFCPALGTMPLLTRILPCCKSL